MKSLAAILMLASIGVSTGAAAQTPYGYGLGTGYGHGLNGGLSGRAAGPGGGSQSVGGDGVLRGGVDATQGRTIPVPGRNAGATR